MEKSDVQRHLLGWRKTGDKKESAAYGDMEEAAEEMGGNDEDKDRDIQESGDHDKSFASRGRERGGRVSRRISLFENIIRHESQTTHTNDRKPPQRENELMYRSRSLDLLSEETKDRSTVPLECTCTKKKYKPWSLEVDEDQRQRVFFDRKITEKDDRIWQAQLMEKVSELTTRLDFCNDKITEKDEQIRQLMEKVTQLTANRDFYDGKTRQAQLMEKVSQLTDRLDSYDRKMTEKDEQMSQLMEEVNQLKANLDHSSDSDTRDSSDESLDSSYHKYSQPSIQSWESQSQPELSDKFKSFQHEFYEKRRREMLEKDEQIKQLEEKLAQLSTKPDICEEKIPVTTWMRELIPHCFGTFGDCEISFRDIENVAIIKGPEEKVTKHQHEMITEMKKVKEEAVALTAATTSVLSSEKGKKYLTSVIDSDQRDARAFVENGELVLAAKGPDVMTTVLKKLKTQLNYVETTISNADLPLAELKSLQMKLERDRLVKVSWNDEGKKIVVEGIKDHVQKSKNDIQQLIEQYRVQKKVFDVKGSQAKLLTLFYSEKIQGWLENIEFSDVVMTDSQISIKMRGYKNRVQQTYRKLRELKTKIQSKSWTLKSEFPTSEDTMLIKKGFDSEDMKNCIEHFELKEKCLVILQLPNTDLSPVLAKKRKSAKPTYADKSSRMSDPSRPKSKQSKLCFNVPNTTCQLVIKPYGDITKEKSDILVCVLDKKSMDLKRTRVGQAFNKACPSLKKDLKAQRKKHPNDTLLVTKGSYSPLKCKAICHVILFPWNPKTSEAHLSRVVYFVLKQVIALGAHSVSFSSLGCGKAFGFPASNMAQTVLACINKSSVGTEIQKIVLLAPDQEVFRHFSSTASTSFDEVVSETSHLLGAVGGIANIDTDEDEDRSDTDGDESDEDSDEDSRVDGEDDSDSYQVNSLTRPASRDSQITLMNLHDKPLDQLWSTLKDNIKKFCLHVDHFNPDHFDSWPKDSRDRIIEKAKKMCLSVEISAQPKTKKSGYSIKGTEKDVDKIINIMKDEFSAYMLKKRILSHEAPKRGTVDFLKHAASSDEPFPSYWSLGDKKTFWTKANELLINDENDFLVDIDSKTEAAIRKLVAQTWDQHLVGQGNDAAGLQHSSIQVISIQRVENSQLFEQYRMQRKRLFEKTAKTGKICPQIGKVAGSKGRVVTTEQLDDFMREELYWEINEHYLFLGTKTDVLNALIHNGIDPKLSSQDAMFGKGIYGAERVTKSDQYTDSPSARTPIGTELYLILTRMLLGNVFLCDDKHPSVVSKGSVKLARPPCVHCLKDKCGCKKQALYDSVMGDGKWLFREFVVYEMNQCYPEYIIKYKRV